MALTKNDQQFLFARAAINALVRAEVDGRVPARFTGDGPAIWQTFRNELSLTDLAVIAIQDAGATMSTPFAPENWWPDWSALDLFQISEKDVNSWVQEAKENLEQPQETILRQQAEILGISLPDDDLVKTIKTPVSHEHWLELPGTGGWLSYKLCSRQDADVYYWENFRILCTTVEEVTLAGIIAWELGAPPNTSLPILPEDQALSHSLEANEAYDEVMGLKRQHGHRDLRVLHKERRMPIWL